MVWNYIIAVKFPYAARSFAKKKRYQLISQITRDFERLSHQNDGTFSAKKNLFIQ